MKLLTISITTIFVFTVCFLLSLSESHAASIYFCPDSKGMNKYKKVLCKDCKCKCPDPGVPKADFDESNDNHFLYCKPGQPIFCSTGAKEKVSDEKGKTYCQCSKSGTIVCSGGSTKENESTILEPLDDLEPPEQAVICDGFWNAFFKSTMGFDKIPDSFGGANSNVGLGDPAPEVSISHVTETCQNHCTPCVEVCKGIWQEGISNCSELSKGETDGGKSPWQHCTDTWQQTLLDCLNVWPWDWCRKDKYPGLYNKLKADGLTENEILAALGEEEAKECIHLKQTNYLGAFKEIQH